MNEKLKNLMLHSKNTFSLTEEGDRESLEKLAEDILNISELAIEDLKEATKLPESTLEFKIAAKLVESKKYIKKITKNMDIAIVFAMWGEQNRLKPKSEDNPNGEDSLRVKMKQLEWITKDTPIKWTLYAVDDGCPHNSGGLAEKMIEDHPLKNNVKVLYLDKALPSEEKALKNLKSADDSRKGGAVILGCLQAIKDNKKAVIYTDADNSVHLGQIGLLLDKYNKGYKVVLGNRKHPDSVLVKQEARWGIGITLLRHIQRMVGQAIFSRGILDTQAAFKLYEKSVLEKILENPSVYDFSFDTDWILSVISNETPFEKVPFAFVDSFAESASIVQGPMTTWETLLKGLLKAVRDRNIPYEEEIGKVLDEEIKSHKDLELLINDLPPELEKVDNKELGNPGIMSPGAIRKWIKHCKEKNK